MPSMRPAWSRKGGYLFDAVVFFGDHGDKSFPLGFRDAAALVLPGPTFPSLAQPQLVSVGRAGVRIMVVPLALELHLLNYYLNQPKNI